MMETVTLMLHQLMTDCRHFKKIGEVLKFTSTGSRIVAHYNNKTVWIRRLKAIFKSLRFSASVSTTKEIHSWWKASVVRGA